LDWSASVMWSTAAPDKATTTRQITSVNTELTSVPEAGLVPGQPGERRRRLRWPWWLAAGVLLMTLATLGATLVDLPYYALAPGSAVEVDRLVSVPDPSPSQSEGRIYLLTVKLTPVNLVEAVQGWIDAEVDVVEQRRVVPSEISEEELGEFNLAQMDMSKQQALGVAFEELGYDAISGQGAEVVQVTAGTPAGMSLAAGDLIVAIDDVAVTSHYDVIEQLADRRPRTPVELTVDPAGPVGPGTMALTLDAAPGQPELAFLGATLATREPRFDFPFPVDIALEEVGGPSAGLAFTLEVIDALTPGDLTGGQRVAATGTIELDGSVGRVGGVAQKTAVAAQADVDLLLVPRAELDEARRLAGDGLVVEAVDNLSGALRVLAEHGGEPHSPSS
jgi:PDZ domain-containing protein